MKARNYETFWGCKIVSENLECPCVGGLFGYVLMGWLSVTAKRLKDGPGFEGMIES